MPVDDEDPRNESLHRLCWHGWADESDGQVEAPTGCFWRLTITEAELPEIASVLLASADELPSLDNLFNPDLLRSLIGAWIVTEDTHGCVTAVDWSTDEPARGFDDRARVRFLGLQREFAAYALLPSGDPAAGADKFTDS